jgi:uncharacterized protein (DUF433 family)
MELLETLSAKPAPLQQDSGGVFRVGGTRVRLDSIIGAFKNGSAAEEILLKYPSLRLTDIYAVITYYLWHSDAVDAYLDSHKALAEKVRRENEARFPREGVRERLLARRPTKA